MKEETLCLSPLRDKKELLQLGGRHYVMVY